MTKPYFRPGTGTVIYNQSGEVLSFRRSDYPDIWQLQQGGMDIGEDIKETLWRELLEETGLVHEDFLAVDEYPDWTIYAYPPNVSSRPTISPGCIGQAHRWFFLGLKPGTNIDLTKASDQEFTDWHWSTFEELVAKTPPMKKEIYVALNNYFKENI